MLQRIELSATDFILPLMSYCFILFLIQSLHHSAGNGAVQQLFTAAGTLHFLIFLYVFKRGLYIGSWMLQHWPPSVCMNVIVCQIQSNRIVMTSLLKVKKTWSFLNHAGVITIDSFWCTSEPPPFGTITQKAAYTAFPWIRHHVQNWQVSWRIIPSPPTQDFTGTVQVLERKVYFKAFSQLQDW